MAGGRPSDYTIWKDRAICMRLSSGESLRSICKRKYYPSRFAVIRWLQANEVFRNHYAQAREMQAEYFIDDIIEIADNSDNDEIETEHGTKFNSEYVQRSRLRVDTRKWAMERMAPKRYGAKQEIEHSGHMHQIQHNAEDYKKAQEALKSDFNDLD